VVHYTVYCCSYFSKILTFLQKIEQKVNESSNNAFKNRKFQDVRKYACEFLLHMKLAFAAAWLDFT
jgi:hypothetical protein